MCGRGANTIINMSVSLVILEVWNCFSRRKVGFLCSLINSRPNIWVKPVFSYTALNICFLLYICIPNLFLFLCNGTQVVVRRRHDMAKILILSSYPIQHIQYVWVILHHSPFNIPFSFCNVLHFAEVTQISHILSFLSFLILFLFFFCL